MSGTISLARRGLFSSSGNRAQSNGLLNWVFGLHGVTVGPYGLLLKQGLQKCFKRKDLELPTELILDDIGISVDLLIEKLLRRLFDQWKQQYLGHNLETLEKLFQRDVREIYGHFCQIAEKVKHGYSMPIPAKMQDIVELRKSGAKCTYMSVLPTPLTQDVMGLLTDLERGLFVASDQVSNRSNDAMLKAIMFNPFVACTNPANMVVVQDTPNGIAAAKQSSLGQCFTVWDLTHSSMLVLDYRLCDEDERADYLADQRQILIDRYVDKVAPDYVATSSKSYPIIQRMIEARLSSGSRPGDMPTTVVNSDFLAEEQSLQRIHRL